MAKACTTQSIGTKADNHQETPEEPWRELLTWAHRDIHILIKDFTIFVLVVSTKQGAISSVAGRRDDQHRRSKKSPTGGRIDQDANTILD